MSAECRVLSAEKKYATQHPQLGTQHLRRYARHIVLPEIGEEGQQRLLASSALVIGAGGLGSAALSYLAAAGIGRLGIVEHDRVELSNLQRQIMFETSDIGRAKTDAAHDRIQEINEGCKVELFHQKLDTNNSHHLIKGFDIVIDGSDNFDTRFTVAQACMDEMKPLISAAISRFSGQISTFKPYIGSPHPCYRCFVPEKPQREITCEQEGILGPLAGVMGSMQAVEAVKELLGIGTSLSGYLLVMDTLEQAMKKITLTRDPACTFCKGSGIGD